MFISYKDYNFLIKLNSDIEKDIYLSVEDVNLKEIAVATQNYTGADLAALCREAAVHAMQNNSKKINRSKKRKEK